VGKRGRQRDRVARTGGLPATGPDLSAASSTYTDPDGNELELRGVLTAKSRARYAETLHGGAHQEDAWQRAIELLFEYLAQSWTVNGVTASGPKELLARYRVASEPERRFVRESLRTHLAEHFPELDAP
jgi:hypothetical protein